MSDTPVQDYLKISKDFITALQTCQRQVEDHPDLIFDRGVLEAAYRTQATIIQQHFTVLGILFDKEFPKKSEQSPVTVVGLDN